METCFLGRGALLVALNVPDAPYLQLTGESEIVVNFTEERVLVKDNRNGREESVEAFNKAISATLTAKSGRIEATTLAYLLKGGMELLTANVSKTLGVVVGGLYWIAPGLGALSVVDNNAVVVDPAKYTIDLDTGLVTVISVTLAPAPWVFTGTGVSYESNGVAVERDLEVKALVTGTDVMSGRKFVAEFFRATLSISDALNIVSKEFKQSSIELTLLADNTRGAASPTLGRFGVINFI